MGCHRNKEKEGSPLFFYCHDRPPALSHYFRCSEKSFSSPFSLTSSLSRLREAPSAFPRHGVSRSSLSNTLRLTANEKDPSAPLGMTIREERVSQRTLYTIQRISIPPHCHFERSEKSFSFPFSTTPSLSRLREAPPTAFPAIRCFPFLAAKHAPSYRQRKRSLGFARDDVA